VSPRPDRRPQFDRAGIALLAAILVVFAALYVQLARRAPPPGFAVPDRVAPPSRAAPDYRAQVVSLGITRFAHAATLVELSDGSLRAFWFGGSREGATDAALYTAVYAPARGVWSSASVILTAPQVQQDLQRRVRKLGNPAVTRDVHGRLWLFFVSVTVGGWSGSAVNYLVSDDDGRTWGRARRLITSPFLNVSTLVKGAPLHYADGSLGVPVYHEFVGKFGELLRIDADGSVRAKVRLSWGQHSLQPVIVPSNTACAVGFMRYAGAPPARILRFETADAGAHWSTPAKTTLPNPNAAVDVLRLADGSLLLAFNNTDSNRNDLSLAHSRDEGRSWRVIHRVEYAAPAAGGQTEEFSYPRLLRASNGELHLVYTANKAVVKHVRFNSSWLEARL
jgi:predicted neuraminidase